MPRRSKARRARRFAADFSASLRWAGRRWCRSSRQTTPIAQRWSRRWRNSWSRISARPTLDDARAAAEEEVTFAESLCSQPQDTLVAVHRSFDNGEVRETFRTLRPRNGQKPARAFSFLEVEGEDEQPGETVDLIGMAERERK